MLPSVVLIALVVGGVTYFKGNAIAQYLHQQKVAVAIDTEENAVKNDSNYSVHKTALEAAIQHTIDFPEDADGWLTLGTLEYNLNDTASAEKSFLKAQVLAPHEDSVLWDLVQLYEREHRYADAEQWAKFAFNGAPWNKVPGGYLMLGDLYENYWTDKSGQAGDVYLQGWQQTDDLDLLRRLALYWKVRDAAKAIPYYQQIIAKLPDGAAKTQFTADLKTLQSSK